MAKIQNPIYKSKLECPVCKTANEFKVIKQGAYTESGRDTDFMPLGVEWSNPTYQKYNPLLFFAATCRNCHYTRELNASYKEWQNDTNFKSYKLPSQAKKHLAELRSENNIIAMLGQKIDQNLYPHESAVLTLLLAVYDEKLLERWSPLDVARFYLRIGWLYREHGDEKAEKNPAEMMLSAIRIEIDQLKNDIGNFGNHLHPLQRTISSDLDLVIEADEKQNLSLKLKKAFDDVQKVWNDLNQDVGRLHDEFEKAAKEINLLRHNPTGNGGFREFSSLLEFLYKARELWPEIPVNETEALTLSLQYYLKAYQDSREIKAGMQQLQAAYLIGELSRRIGNLPQAREYFKNANKMAQELMMKNRNDNSIYSNAQKIFEMSLEQGRIVKSEKAVTV